MKKSTSQVLNSVLIIAGGALLIFEIAGENKNVYVMIAGIIMLMFGLYRATNFWVETKDDHLQEKEENDIDKTN